MTADRIAAALEAEIVTGAFKPGEELKQGQIAERFSISRIPVRDALQLLAARGLIDLVPNRRARVISLSAAEIREVYDLRLLLETDCLNQSIAKMSERDIDSIEAALAHSTIDAGTQRWAQGDWEFHRSLYLPTGRPRQLAMIEGLRRTCRIHIAGYGILPSRTGEWLQDHEDLVKACRARSGAEAASILKSHIQTACRTLLAAIADKTGP
ncbi:GntR family transcriptional regulator [Roseibium salinum]|uniref:GntR family transcriptional regulator n=1 Tax=Roseibium salinum TaxID=1604349 RepID=A0ABT3R5H3_9HYPH|nr:GntR family transcriptional regulator [Roseibium sp. DSM 29163]MCX2724488.1 GntR family transcriptional regulator [Roseibium sp. DSM 29163]MDN3721517.1 GntR family transcriptional regulator [Roseibium salinum]